MSERYLSICSELINLIISWLERHGVRPKSVPFILVELLICYPELPDKYRDRLLALHKEMSND